MRMPNISGYRGAMGCGASSQVATLEAQLRTTEEQRKKAEGALQQQKDAATKLQKEKVRFTAASICGTRWTMCHPDSLQEQLERSEMPDDLDPAEKAVEEKAVVEKAVEEKAVVEKAAAEKAAAEKVAAEGRPKSEGLPCQVEGFPVRSVSSTAELNAVCHLRFEVYVGELKRDNYSYVDTVEQLLEDPLDDGSCANLFQATDDSSLTDAEREHGYEKPLPGQRVISCARVHVPCPDKYPAMNTRTHAHAHTRRYVHMHACLGCAYKMVVQVHGDVQHRRCLDLWRPCSAAIQLCLLLALHGARELPQAAACRRHIRRELLHGARSWREDIAAQLHSSSGPDVRKDRLH